MRIGVNVTSIMREWEAKNSSTCRPLQQTAPEAVTVHCALQCLVVTLLEMYQSRTQVRPMGGRAGKGVNSSSSSAPVGLAP